MLLPFDPDQHERTLAGAHEAGQAINTTKTTGGHALSYGLTTQFGIPHGFAVLAVMQVLVRETPIPELDELFQTATSLPFQSGFETICEDIWARQPFRSYFRTATAADVLSLTITVNVERLDNHPQPFTADDL